MSFNNIPAGKDLPNDIYVVIEIPANHDPIKYEIDKATGYLRVDRPLRNSSQPPTLYGFIPRTYCDTKVAKRLISDQGWSLWRFSLFLVEAAPERPTIVSG